MHERNQHLWLKHTSYDTYIDAADSSATTTGVFLPVERELVFDIDLTDYDDVRTCGKEGHICSKCWPLMAVAVQVKPFCLQSAAEEFTHACSVLSKTSSRTPVRLQEVLLLRWRRKSPVTDKGSQPTLRRNRGGVAGKCHFSS